MFKPFRVSYRLDRPRLWPRIVWSACEDIWHGIKNIFRWAPVIWFDADFDWEYLAEVMEYKLRRMSKRAGDARIVVGWNSTARQTLICAELLKRLREDDYCERAKACGLPDGAVYRHASSNQKHDLQYLGKILSRHMLSWWD